MGAPAGNSNRATQYRLKHEIEKAMRRRSTTDDLEALQRIIDAQLTKAEDGDIQAFKEIMDRWAGRAPQGVELTGEDGGPVVIKASPLDERI